MQRPAALATLWGMVRHSELIAGRGRLTAEADLPVPCSDPEFVLSLLLDDAAPTERVEFSARTPDWRWSAGDVEWTHRTDSWLHFGGAAVIDSRWPCRYRATARIAETGEIVHLELRVYAMPATSREARGTPFIVLRGVGLADSSQLHKPNAAPDG